MIHWGRGGTLRCKVERYKPERFDLLNAIAISVSSYTIHTCADRQEIGQALNLIRPIVQNKLTEKSGSGARDTSGIATMTAQVDGLLARSVNHLGLPVSVYNAAKHIAHMAREKAEIDGRSYTSIATGVLYLTCILMENKIKTKALAEYAQITDSTIKLVCKRIAIYIHVVVREEWKTMYAKGYQALVKMGQAAKESQDGGKDKGKEDERDRAQSQTPSVAGDAGTPVSVKSGASPTPSPKEGVKGLPVNGAAGAA
jgi:hypothetical protein